MTVIDIQPDDTGDIARAVGETTRNLGIIDSPITARRPAADQTRRDKRAFASVGSTGELPILGHLARLRPANAPLYAGRHRAPEDAEPAVTIAPATLWSRMIGRLLSRKAGGR